MGSHNHIRFADNGGSELSSSDSKVTRKNDSLFTIKESLSILKPMDRIQYFKVGLCNRYSYAYSSSLVEVIRWAITACVPKTVWMSTR